MAKSNKVEGRLVVLDPGHGTPDPGAVGLGGVQEQAVNLAVSKALRDLLIAEGYVVKMTRDTDAISGGAPVKATSRDAVVNSSLSYRVRVCRESQAVLFISIHCNAAAARSAVGFEVFYNPAGVKVACAVFEAFKKAFPAHKARRVQQENFYVLRKNPAPAILVECEFISNPDMEVWLQQKGTVAQLAEAIRDGIKATRV
jgi:N-acetylmuramoyl-L-alanine amidase